MPTRPGACFTVRCILANARIACAVRFESTLTRLSLPSFSSQLEAVGRSREALGLARMALANDRYKLWKIARVLRTLEAVGLSAQATGFQARHCLVARPSGPDRQSGRWPHRAW